MSHNISRSVLIVDDNRDLAVAMRDLISFLGHDAQAAFDGVDAIQLILKTRPDVAIVDLTLPGLSGYGVAGILREALGRDGQTLIAMSGHSGIKERQRAYDVGFDLFLVKPIDAVELENLLGAPDLREAIRSFQPQPDLSLMG
jgi:CheY-like chemotaxis protein